MKNDIILIDKPAGWTSFDVVAKMRGKIRAEYTINGIKPTKKQLKVGHAGTLDPFATGLLIILLGDACKKAGEYLKLDKTYEFTAKLGEVSTTGDPEGEIVEYGKWNMEKRVPEGAVIPDVIRDPDNDSEQSESKMTPTLDEVKAALEKFTGQITQIPPAFSAIKINGQRAYKLAREGKSVDIPARQVTINRLELVSYEYPLLKAVCDVSSGTYVRTLVEDIGKELGTGAYCQQLRRTRIADYSINDAKIIEDYFKSSTE